MVLAGILKRLILTGTFSSEKGRIKLFGKIDYVLYHARSFAINFQHIAEKLGEAYLFKLGYESGVDCANDYIEYETKEERWLAYPKCCAAVNRVFRGWAD